MSEQNKPQQEIEVEGGEGYQGKTEGLSAKQIILNQLQRCCIEGGKEMAVGGLQKRIIDGKVIEIVVPNQKEIFINSVEMLWILVQPKALELKEDDERKKEMVMTLNRVQAIKDNFKKKRGNIMEIWKTKYKRNPDRKESLNIALSLYDRQEEESKLYDTKNILLLISGLLSKLNYFEEKGGGI